MPFRMSARGQRFMNMEGAAATFRERLPSHEDKAAEIATSTSRVTFTSWLSGRPLAPGRAGRPTTGGAFANLLEWKRDQYGFISFDAIELDSKAPYWIIQEIGTGQSARVLNAGGSGVTVKSQRGRRLPRGFFWGDGVSAVSTVEGATRDVALNPTSRRIGVTRRNIPSPFGSSSRRTAGGPTFAQQQLYPMFLLPPGTITRPTSGIIRREIVGKHFVQKGGLAGFTLLREQLAKDFKNDFKEFAIIR